MEILNVSSFLCEYFYEFRKKIFFWIKTILIFYKENSFLQVKHINDPFIDTEYMIYLFKYDSTHGTFTEPIESDCETIIIGGNYLFDLLFNNQFKFQKINILYFIHCSVINVKLL